MDDIALRLDLDDARGFRVARPVRGSLRVIARAPVEGCTVVAHARLRGAHVGDPDAQPAGGYDEPSVEIGPFDWAAGEHRVSFELPPIRGPATRRGRLLALSWTLVAEVRDASGWVVASATWPLHVAARDRRATPADVVVGGYRDAPRVVASAFEPELGSAHVEGPRAPKLTFGERIEETLFGNRDVNAQLEARPSRVEPGATFDVVLFLYARTATTLEGARVALVRHEAAPHPQALTRASDVVTVAEAAFTDEVTLAPGHRRFTTRVTMPEDAASSYADEKFVAEWVLRAVVQPRHAPPFVLELVLTVA